MNVMRQLHRQPHTARRVVGTALFALAALVLTPGGTPGAAAAPSPSASPSPSPSGSPTATPTTPFGDLNGDGRSDVVVRNTTTGQLLVYRGSEKGFAAPVQIGTGWNGMSAIVRHGDFDGDGHDDVIARVAKTGALWLYRGSGAADGVAPAFLSRVLLGASGWNGMSDITPVGDFDGDGHADLLAVQTSTGGLYLYPGKASGLGPRRLLGSGWNGMDQLTPMGDVDHDGSVDLLARQKNTSDIWVYPGTGAGPLAKFGARTLVGSGAAGWQRMESFVSLGDLDHDGSNDLAAVTGFDPWLLRTYSLKNGHLSPAKDIGTGWRPNYRPIL